MKIFATFIITLLIHRGVIAESYREPFRPQFHFTPAKNWINDPNGMVFYEGEYHLFYQYNPFGDKWGHMSWGHAMSKDLLHWEHLPLALAEENDIMIFSGSAVIDWENSSGFGKEGKPPMVAIYTGHYTKKPLQNQHIAYSNDRGRTWTKYEKNPVLDLGMRDFRDPKVIWHKPTRKWVMTVALPSDRKVRFYGSPNLKEWSQLGEFGPAGSTKGIWECPDLFPVKVEGKSEMKWVLIVNAGSGAPAGGAGCQYFVGNFDGAHFTPEEASPTAKEFVPEGRVLADFEGDDYGGWRATGTAFGTGPAHGTLARQQAVGGFRGKGLVNTYFAGDTSEGTLTSPEFEIANDYISFLIGGGNLAGKTCMNLLVDGKTVRTATGDADERLNWKSWDVRDLRNKKAAIEIVDREKGGWGHLNVDQIILADKPARPAPEPGHWTDFGRDFYAGVSWSDIPNDRRIWLGWMSSPQYAGDVPTSPWRSAMSFPRDLAVRQVNGDWRMLQQPVKELAALRGKRERLQFRKLTGTKDLSKAAGVAGDLYEVEAIIRPSSDAAFEWQLRKDAEHATIIRADVAGGYITFDRTHSGTTGFHPQFAGSYRAPLRIIDGVLKLRMLVDTSSVELFVNDGEAVQTNLILPPPDAHGLELNVTRGSLTEAEINVWALKSVWNEATAHEPK